MPRKKGFTREKSNRLAEEKYERKIQSFSKTHGLFYLSSSEYKGYWPCQILPDGHVLSITENLL
jgi:hypothetical protein